MPAKKLQFDSERSSPNFNQRPLADGRPIKPTHIILHYTDCESTSEALDILTDPERQVSAHFLVDYDGKIFKLVAPYFRAWHAGVSCWQDIDNVNDYSIGIEIQNAGHRYFHKNGSLEPFPNEQIDALLALLSHLCDEFDINPLNILGHSDIAPERKLDPGEHFPWETLGKAGLGIWPAPEVNFENTLLLQYQLKNLGYNVPTHGQMDDQTWCVIDSFKRHFYPKLL